MLAMHSDGVDALSICAERSCWVAGSRLMYRKTWSGRRWLYIELREGVDRNVFEDVMHS